MTTNSIYDIASEYIVPTFPGDHDKRTLGVGFLLEDHSALGHSTDNADTIEAIGVQMIRFAAEIRYNQTLPPYAEAAD